MKNRHALLLGATGATGQKLLKLLLEDSNFDKVTIFVRREVKIKHEKRGIAYINTIYIRIKVHRASVLTIVRISLQNWLKKMEFVVTRSFLL